VLQAVQEVEEQAGGFGLGGGITARQPIAKAQR
jgi:hypothetical protein